MKLRSSGLHLRCMTTATVLLLASLPVAAQVADRSDFDLICTGTGEHLASHDTYGYDWDDKKHKYVQHSGFEYNQEQIQGSAQIEIHDGAGRIRPPKALAPPLSGGHDGWWPLRDLRITPDHIHAAFRYNAMNSPTIEIDRRSGYLALKGMETFEGSCTPVDPDKNRF